MFEQLCQRPSVLRLLPELVRCSVSTFVRWLEQARQRLLAFPLSGRSMSCVAPKRCCVDEDERRELGRLAKRQRIHTAESKELLATDMAKKVLTAADRAATWSREVALVRSLRARFFEVLGELRFQSIATIDHGQVVAATLEVLAPTRDVEEHMSEIRRLEDDMNDIFAAAPVDSLSIAQSRRLSRKVAHYKDCLQTPLELENLNHAPRRPALLEYDDGEEDELVEQGFVELFSKAKEAVHRIEDVTGGSPLTALELAEYTKVLHDDLVRLHDTIASLVGNIPVYNDILNRSYKLHIPLIQCMVCNRDRVDASECDECLGGGICAECFAGRLESLAADDWQDSRTVRQVAEFECVVCHKGHYDIRLGHLLHKDAARLHQIAAVETSNAAAGAAAEKEATTDTRRRLASFKGLSYVDKVYAVEREIIGDTVATKCPSCRKPFYDFDGCCALTCACGTHFCGLCFKTDANWDAAMAHDHVMTCGNDVPGFHELFMNSDAWMVHIKRRQYELCKSYLSSTDLPRRLKDRLQADFPRP